MDNYAYPPPMHVGHRIHVLHIVNSLQVGGLEQVVVNLINGLPPLMYRHTICCIDQVGAMLERIQQPVSIINMDKGNRPDHLLPFKIARCIKNDPPHIIHTRNWSAIDGVIAGILSGVKCIVHDEHGRDASDPRGANLKRKLARRFFSPWIRRFIPVSTELEQWLLNDVRIPACKVQKILNGVDTERFIPVADKTAARKQLNLPSDAFIVGFVGRLDPVKDLTTLVQAFSLFAQNIQDRPVCLVLVGNGPERHDLEQQVAQLGLGGKVIFTGERSDIPMAMQSFDLFALTSIAEGIPMTILEAMASGLPVVATAVGGIHELVSEGETGCLATAKDVPAIASALSAYASAPDLILHHGSTARQRAERSFSLNAMVASYDNLYRHLLSGK